MPDERSTPAWLDAELACREADVARIAAAVVELESHPGLRLLTAEGTSGRTAARWRAVRAVRDRLWREVGLHRAAVEAAREVRDRRSRPGEREWAELHRLLVAPSVEVERTPVALAERGLTDERERVSLVAVPALQDRLEQAFAQVRDLVVECAEAHDRAVAALVAPAERLAAARAALPALAPPPGDPDAAALDAATAGLAAVVAGVTADPLTPPDPRALAAAGAVADRIERRLAGRGPADPAAPSAEPGTVPVVPGPAAPAAALDAALADLRDAALAAPRAQRAAEAAVVGPLPALPPDPVPGMTARRAALDRVADPAERAARAEALRRDAVDATAGLRAAAAFARGLLERREELAGRLARYRERAAGLGLSEDPELRALDARAERELAARPCDLAAASTALGEYRRVLRGERTA